VFPESTPRIDVHASWQLVPLLSNSRPRHLWSYSLTADPSNSAAKTSYLRSRQQYRPLPQIHNLQWFRSTDLQLQAGLLQCIQDVWRRLD